MYQCIQRAIGLGALLTLATGCAGPRLQEWDNPIYLRHVDSGDRQDGHQDESLSANQIPQQTPDRIAPGETLKPSSDETLQIDDAVRYAVMNHPVLRRQAYNVRVAAGREVQSRLYPNPTFAAEAESLGADDGNGGETVFLLQQEIVTSGKLDKAAAVAEADRLLAQAAFRNEVFQVATRVRSEYVTTLAAQRRLESEQELFSLAVELLSTADAQVEAGAATEPDRLRAEVVREQAAIDLHTAKSSSLAARRNLATSLGLDGDLKSKLDGDLLSLPVLPSQEETLSRVLDKNTRLEQARIAIDRARRAHDLAEAQVTPNLFVGLGPRWSDPNNETTLDLRIGLEIPLFDRNQGEIAAATAQRLAAGASLESVRLELIEAVSRAWSAYESSRFAVESYRISLLPKAERTLNLTREAYRAGKTDYLRLLDAQQTYVRSRIAYVDALEALHQTAAIIEGLMQTSLPWRDADGAINEIEGSM